MFKFAELTNRFEGVRAHANSFAVLTLKYDAKMAQFVPFVQYVQKAPINDGVVAIGPMMAPSLLVDSPDPDNRVVVDRVTVGATNMVAVDFQSAIKGGVDKTTLSGRFKEWYLVGDGMHASVYVKDGGNDGNAALFTMAQGKTGTIRRNMRKLADAGIPVKKFIAGVSYNGASGQKDGKLYFLSVPLNRWTMHLNVVSSGAYNALFASAEVAGGIKAGAVSKTAVRLGGRTAAELPSHRTFRCVALYMGKYGEKDSLDGEFFFRANAWTPVGSTTHDRTFTIKGQGIAVSSTSIQTMIHHLDPKPIHVDTSKMSAIFEGVKKSDKDAPTKYTGRIVIFGHGKPELLADMNAVKTIGDFTKWEQHVQEVYGDVDVEKDGVMNLSSQIVSKLLAADLDAAVSFIQKKAKEFCVSAFKTPVAHDSLPSKKALEDSFRRDQNTVDLDPEAGSKYGTFFLANLQQKKIHVLKQVHDLKIPMKGYMRVALGDIASIFGQYILKPNEIVCPSIPESQAVMVKYPSAGLREYVLVNLVSVDEYVLRAAQILDDNELAVIEEFVRNMKGKLVMVSGHEILRKMLAGFDFDTDELFICTEPEVLRIFQKQGQGLAVLIDPSKSVAKQNPLKYHCDSTVFYESTMNVLGMGSTAIVGCVVNFFTMWQRLYIEGNYAAAKKILRDTYKNKGFGKESYKKVFHVYHDDTTDIDCVNVDADIMSDMWKQLRYMSLSTESIKAFLEDINVAAGRFSSEICIDTIKNAYRLQIPGIEQLISSTPDYSFRFGKGGKGKREVSLEDRLFKPLDTIVEAEFKKAYNAIVEKGLELPIDVQHECTALWESLSQDQRYAIVKLLDDCGALRSAYPEMKNDPDLVKDLFHAWEGEYRAFTENLKPMQRIQVIVGAKLKGDTYQAVTRIVGMALLPEWYSFVAYYSEREGAMLAVVGAELSMPTDIKTRFVRCRMRADEMLPTMQKVCKRARSKFRYQDTWSVATTTKSQVLTRNGEPIKNDKNKSLFVNVGKANKPSQTMRQATVGFEGKAVFCQVTEESNGDYADLLMIIRNDSITEPPVTF